MRPAPATLTVSAERATRTIICQNCQSIGRRTILAYLEQDRNEASEDESSNGEAMVGKLSELRRRASCVTCQQIYQKLNAAPEGDSSVFLLTDAWEDFILALKTDEDAKPGVLGLLPLASTPNNVHTSFFTVRKLNPLWVDIARQRKWIARCDRSHRTCRQSRVDRSIASIESLLLVDIEGQCLVKKPLNTR